MIGPDLFITNHHVVNAREQNEAVAPLDDLREQARSAVIVFDFDSDTSETESIATKGLVAADESLDYAILRLEKRPTRNVLTLSRSKISVQPSTYLPVNIIQHPRGTAKRIAFR